MFNACETFCLLVCDLDTPKSTGKTVNDTQQSTKKTKSAPNSDKKKKKKLQNGRVSSGFSKLHII